MRDRDPALAPPSVAADVYDREYFTRCCAGSHEWRKSNGEALAGIYGWALDMAGFAPGDTVIDIGTGRGEVPVLAAMRGAGRAVGVEYSTAALKLAETTATAHGVDSVELVLADARRVPLPDECADVVTMLDVVEHLSPSELDQALAEVSRLLAADGRLFIHTFPSRTVYRVTYRLQRLAVPWRMSRWPRDPRMPEERLMHVNEQSLGRLRRTLRRNGFRVTDSGLGDWVYADFVPEVRARALYRRLARIAPLRRLAVGNMWALARRA